MEIEYREVAQDWKYCSVRTPATGLKGLCGVPARYVVKVGDGWYWRCAPHHNVVEFNLDGSVKETGHYSRFYPTMK